MEPAPRLRSHSAVVLVNGIDSISDTFIHPLTIQADFSSVCGSSSSIKSRCLRKANPAGGSERLSCGQQARCRKTALCCACACACLPSFAGDLPDSECARMPCCMHLCVTLGKKARLHLMFTLAKAETNTLPSLLDVCLEGVLKFIAAPQIAVLEMRPFYQTKWLCVMPKRRMHSLSWSQWVILTDGIIAARGHTSIIIWLLVIL